jgi:threonine dehydrogenase-like Zn-dependent dehydrogenase
LIGRKAADKPAAANLENGRLDPTRVITDPLPAEEIGRGFEIMEKQLKGVIKPPVTYLGSGW